MSLTFSKEERLCSRKLIDQLYNEGHRMMAFPYSVQWLILKNDAPSEATGTSSRFPFPCQVLIVAPKRRFHNAVDRNRVKRLTRECWRHNKTQLYDHLQACGLSLALALVYVNNEIMPYDKLLARMEKLVQQLEKEIPPVEP